MRELKGSRGSALAWAVCLLLVLTVLLAGMAAVASAFQRRGARDQSASQAFLAATGAVDAVLSLVDGALAEIPFGGDTWGNGGAVPLEDEIWTRVAGLFPLLPRGLGARVELTDFDLGQMPAERVEGYIERISESEWRVSITASSGGAEYTASALLTLEITAAGETREQAVPAQVSLGEIFHANVIENLVLPRESALLTGGGALYLGHVGMPQDGEAEIAPGGALFTREKLLPPVRESDSRALEATSGGAVSITGGESFSGEMPGFGQVFLPASEITRADGAALAPGLSGALSGARLCAVSGKAELNLAELPGDARLYIFMRDGAELTVSGESEALVYIYCPRGGKIIADASPGPVKMRGAVLADSLEIISPQVGAAHVEIRYTEPPDSEISAETGVRAVSVYPAGAFDYKWSFVRYE